MYTETFLIFTATLREAGRHLRLVWALGLFRQVKEGRIIVGSVFSAKALVRVWKCVRSED